MQRVVLNGEPAGLKSGNPLVPLQLSSAIQIAL